jgi:hypothetical protein
MAIPSTDATLDALPVDRDAVVWTVVVPAVVVLPLAVLSYGSLTWQLAMVLVGFLHAAVFGLIGDDNRSESMEATAYHSPSESGSHANPDHALRSMAVLRYTGAVSVGCFGTVTAMWVLV